MYEMNEKEAIILERFTNLLKEAPQMLERQKDLDKFAEEVSKILYSLLIEIIVYSIEKLDDKIKESEDVKENWKNIKRDYRTILMPHAVVVYKRRYYQHKQTGEYAYLVDKFLGIDSYQRLSQHYEEKIKSLFRIHKSFAGVLKELAKASSSTEISAQTIRNKVFKDKKKEEKKQN
ncbi:hypothetical protein Calkro_0407 [Caldicellulosiruptor kronotskyensis 2002]|uniref:Uncharacterized protein n=1 Tax=Caldicellulosiruptor kronotskyensis (strain DSM 18902 / VKM B-2412 / 2002) TaxID=632348 RepID=E4SE20_CALK2|nr:UPF0236 family protein [Caldicellulosiruptor kronotskyensis]ADQ45307.1 hypothetical protein Calkro_0407 [Caldicellulosiruptor kronotskyensis 2002]